ncbi:uncharacterized protein TNCV_3654041 [Trichonephila clavipes]|nr:uncharacterized protein TNCV_3654041 [Trichonephila clavipes]
MGLNWAKRWHDKDVDFRRSSASVMNAHLKFWRTKFSLCVVVVEKSFIDCVVRTAKHPTKTMIWSVISSQGNGRLYVVKSVMREDQYKYVLQNRLIPQLEEWFPSGEPYIFMQNGAPCHTARSIKAFWQNKISLCWIGRINNRASSKQSSSVNRAGLMFDPVYVAAQSIPLLSICSSLVVKVVNLWMPCHEFTPLKTHRIDRPMQLKSVESSFRWWGVEVMRGWMPAQKSSMSQNDIAKILRVAE